MKKLKIALIIVVVVVLLNATHRAPLGMCYSLHETRDTGDVVAYSHVITFGRLAFGLSVDEGFVFTRFDQVFIESANRDASCRTRRAQNSDLLYDKREVKP